MAGIMAYCGEYYNNKIFFGQGYILAGFYAACITAKPTLYSFSISVLGILDCIDFSSITA
jgi:hypothetical protein